MCLKEQNKIQKLSTRFEFKEIKGRVRETRLCVRFWLDAKIVY